MAMKKSGCSSKAAMALASVVLVATEGAFLCPTNHCLMQIGQGTGAPAFSCEQYPESDGYQCAMESETCKCAGSVKYGDFAGNKQSPANATWSAAKTVSDSIVCNNGNMGGDPIKKGFKVCFCTPTSPATTTRKTTAPVTTATTGYAVPKCFIAQVSVKHTSLDGAALYGQGANRGLLGTFEKKAFNDYFNATGTGTRIVADDAASAKYILQVPCDGSTNICFGSPELALQNVLALRSDAAQFDATFAALWKAATPILGKTMAAMGPGVRHTFKTLPVTTTTTAAPVTTTTTGNTTEPDTTVSGATRAFAINVMALAVFLGFSN